MLSHFSLGPILSPRVDEAQATESLKRTRWQQALVETARALEQPRSGYGALQVLLGGGAGIVAGAAFGGLSLYLQALVGAATALAVYWFVPTAWAVVEWLRAPTFQRDQARKYAEELEAYGDHLFRWHRCREIGEDFRREGLEFATSIEQGGWAGSVEELDKYWRERASAIGLQLADQGLDLTDYVNAQLTSLNNMDDGYGADQRARIRGTVMSSCQNIASEVRQQPQPVAPTKPS
jgi:hypothetical protein